MDHKQKGFKAVMVALNNGEVQFYREKYLINTIKCDVSLLKTLQIFIQYFVSVF